MSMSDETVLVCSCQRTMDIDAERLGKMLRQPAMMLHRELCRSEVGAFQAACKAGGRVRVACTQEAPLFREVAAQIGVDDDRLRFTNIRERAGWCQAKGAALPKIAALLAEASLEVKPAGTRTLTSSGVCLVYGAGQEALDAAAALASRLDVTLLLSDSHGVMPPAVVDVAIHAGRIKRVSGHLGAFEVEVDGYASPLPSSRAVFEFTVPRDGAKSTCDLILDMSGGTPLFSASQRREGYFAVDPAHPAAVARAMFEITDMVGEFEKPLYVTFDAAACAHSRNRKVGCHRCLDVCPTGAISPVGDHVAVDPFVCGGCGDCSAVCPTGAVSYDYPTRADLARRFDALISTYLDCGGRHPVLLVHDQRHGDPLVAAIARFGRGLPANVLPLSVYSVHQLGHDALAGMLGAGAEHIVILAPPSEPAETAALAAEVALMEAFLGALGFDSGRLHLLAERDPDVVENALYALGETVAIRRRDMAGSHPPETRGSDKRSTARAALATVHAAAPTPSEHIALPAGAPYGRVVLDVQACTLCLACVGACPTHALGDSGVRPELLFTAAFCVQCGICTATCPESAIRLEPRYDFTTAAVTPHSLKIGEPFACVRCGKSFGSRSSVERIVERLKGKHAMFKSDAQVRLIQMCDDCRVIALTEGGGDPYTYGERPRVRTTDDYLVADNGEATKKPN